MSITDSDSVLILGAGVSAPFGLSLGGDLVEQIADQLEREVEGHVPRRRANLIQNNLRAQAFEISPVALSSFELGVTEEVFQAKARELCLLLRSSTHDTIDDFLVDHISYSAIIKCAISLTLFRQMYRVNFSSDRFHVIAQEEYRSIQNYRLKSFLNRYLNEITVGSALHRDRNWIHILINIVRNAVRNAFLETTKVKIISFNYDPILEYVLGHLFHRVEANFGHYSDYFEILHVHGKFPDFEESIERPNRLVAEWAKSICVVQESPENISEKVANDRAKAIEWMSGCQKLYAAGFAFSGANCRLIGLDQVVLKKLYYLNYNGNMGLEQAVERVTAVSQNMRSHQFEKHRPDASSLNPVGVEAWFAAGYAGETPA